MSGKLDKTGQPLISVTGITISSPARSRRSERRLCIFSPHRELHSHPRVVEKAGSWGMEISNLLIVPVSWQHYSFALPATLRALGMGSVSRQ